MNNKETNLKEKLKQALTSTIKDISDDIKINDHKETFKIKIQHSRSLKNVKKVSFYGYAHVRCTNFKIFISKWI